MDVVAFLLFEELNTATLGWQHPDRDVYFSSKGHDVPGLYAALFALGVIPRELVQVGADPAGQVAQGVLVPFDRRGRLRALWALRDRRFPRSLTHGLSMVISPSTSVGSW